MAVSLLCSATALKQVWSRKPAAEIAQAGTASASEKKNTALELYVRLCPDISYDKEPGPSQLHFFSLDYNV